MIQMSTSNHYLSPLHYFLSQPEGVSFKYIDFFLYFTNAELGKLDIAISEVSLRKIFIKRVGLYYNHNPIISRSEFDWILSRNISLTKCKFDFIFPGITTVITQYIYSLN